MAVRMRRTSVLRLEYLAIVLLTALAGLVVAGTSRPRPLVHAHGAALPPGALARLGSLRLRHRSGVRALAFSPNGKVLASGGLDSTVRLWDRATGKELRQLRGPITWVTALAFAPDGKTLAAGTSHSECQLYLYDPASGKLLHTLSGPHHTRMITFSADGKRLASTGDDGVVCVHETRTGKMLLRIQAHKDMAAGVFFTDDDKVLVSASKRDPLIRFWDAESGKVRNLLRVDERGIFALALAPGGKTLATAGVDDTVRLWDLASGKEAQSWRAPHSLRNVLFTAGGTLLAAMRDRHQATRIWNVSNRKEICRLESAGEELAVSADGRTLAIPGVQIRLWDLRSGKEMLPGRGHQGSITHLCFAPDGRAIYTIGWDNTLRVWDAGTGGEVKPARTVRGGHITLLVRKDRVLSLERGREETILRDESSGKELFSVLSPGAAALSSDGKQLAGVTDDRTVCVWDVARGKLLYQLKPVGGAGAIGFAPDNQTLVSVGLYLTLWDARTGRKIKQVVHGGIVTTVAFSSDGRWLLTGADRAFSTTRFWDLKAGKEKPFSSPGLASIWNAQLSPGGWTLATMSSERNPTVSLLDFGTGRLLGRWKGEEGKHPRVFAFSPDGRTLAVAGSGQTVQLWDAYTGQEIRRYTGQGERIMCLAFSPDGRKLVTGSIDGIGLVWDLTAKPAAGALDARRLHTLWDDLGADDAKRADRAFWTLAAAPREAVALLRRQLMPAPTLTPRLRHLLADLDDDAFAVREKATQELRQMGEETGPALRTALAGKPSPEARRRITTLLARLKKPQRDSLSPRLVQQLRAVRVLEQIGIAEARAVLEALATGSWGPTLADEGRAALARRRQR